MDADGLHHVSLSAVCEGAGGGARRVHSSLLRTCIFAQRLINVPFTCRYTGAPQWDPDLMASSMFVPVPFGERFVCGCKARCQLCPGRACGVLLGSLCCSA